MSVNSITNAIRSRFATQFSATQPSVGIAYDSVPFEPSGPYVRISIPPPNSQQVAMGSTRRFRNAGAVLFQVFTPAGDGPGENNQIMDSIIAIFRGVQANGVTYQSVTAPSSTVASGWLQRTFSINYYADDYV